MIKFLITRYPLSEYTRISSKEYVRYARSKTMPSKRARNAPSNPQHTDSSPAPWSSMRGPPIPFEVRLTLYDPLSSCSCSLFWPCSLTWFTLSVEVEGLTEGGELPEDKGQGATSSATRRSAKVSYGLYGIFFRRIAGHSIGIVAVFGSLSASRSSVVIWAS